MSNEGLVPDDLGDFRSSAFWQGFFKSRGDRPFEWYGDWRQLKPLAMPLCSGKRILMLGCGNSSLSADMYDDGLQEITNVDFVEAVVRDMMRRNLRQRPCMRWLVMDMTQMDKFKDGAFDVAFDKGGLDALMGDEGDAADDAGVRMLAEVARVVDAQRGTYICVTLAQPHVLRLLLARLAVGWRIAVHKPPPPPDMARAPLQPLLLVATREPGLVASGAAPEVALRFSPAAGGPDAEQLAGAVQVVREANALRASGAATAAAAMGSAAPGRPRPASGGVANPSAAAQDAFAELHPVGRLELQAAAGATSFSPAAPQSSDEASEGSAAPRFRAAVVDLAPDAAARAARECGVFIVPQGREHEWLFASEEGQRQLAAGCASRRVIIVSLARGQQYGDLAALQAELSPLVLPLAPAVSRALPKSVPFMTAGEGIGRRTTVAEAVSELSGPIVVEDVTLQEDGADEKVLRRMVFVNNRNLIQSEAVVIPPAASGTQPTSQPAAAAGSTASGSRKGGKQTRAAAPHKPSAPAPPPAQQPAPNAVPAANGNAAAAAIDHSQLPCEYHQAMVAGLSLASPALKARTQGGARGAVSVVGLGGGGLPAFLATRCRLRVDAVELDPVVAQLARQHFQLPESEHLQVSVQDGLAAVAAAETGQYDAIIVDAGSGDATAAMSCPPPAFLTPEFLQQARAALSPGGVLAVNCVTRSAAAFSGAVSALKSAFPQVHSLQVQEDVNRVLFGLTSPLVANGQAKKAGSKSTAAGSASALSTILRQRILMNDANKEQTDDIAEMLHELQVC